MAKKEKALTQEQKKKVPFNVLRKGAIAGLLGLTIGFGCLGLAGCSNGQDGKDGLNGTQWYSGTATPTTQGVNGDYYFDTDDFIIYTKVDGIWVSLGSIKGERGTVWHTGTDITGTESEISATITGAEIGDLYFNTESANVYKCTAENTWEYLVCLKTNSITPSTPEVKEQVDLTDQFTWTDSKAVVYNTGSEYDSQNFKLSNFIDVSGYAGRTIRMTLPVYMNNSGGQGNFGAVYYNASQAFAGVIRQMTMANSQSENSVEYFDWVVPASAKYIRISYYKDSYTNYTFDGNFSCVVLGTNTAE